MGSEDREPISYSKGHLGKLWSNAHHCCLCVTVETTVSCLDQSYRFLDGPASALPRPAPPPSPLPTAELSDTDYVTLSAFPCPPGLRGKPAPHSGLRGFEWLGLCLALCGISRPPSRSPRLTGLLSLLKPAESVLADPSPCKPLPADPGPPLLAGGYGSAQLSPLRPCWLK